MEKLTKEALEEFDLPGRAVLRSKNMIALGLISWTFNRDLKDTENWINEKFKNLPLRKGVGIILLNKENKVLVAKRIDNPKNFWQMPQGGIDEGEDSLKAAYRELEEETSIKNVELIQELDGTMTYELPNHLLGIIWKGKYRGQKQKWYLMRFTGDEKEINIKTKKPEFLDWKWIEINQITESVVDFKLHVYRDLKEKINKIVNL